MHHPDVLENFGCTAERLREIFTSKALEEKCSEDCTDEERQAFDKKKTRADSNLIIRQRFEKRIRDRVNSGVSNNFSNSRPLQAVDIGYDAAPIQRETLPLMMWATGKITNTRALFASLSESCGGGTAGDQAAQKFFKKMPTESQMGELDIPRICDFQVDIVHSYVTRIHAGLDSLWSNLWPLYKYNPRSSDAIAQLRGDALTQRVDIISEAFNYRHHDSQCRRDMIRYGKSVIFPRCAWDRKVSWRFKPTNTGEPGKETESYVTREGVDFVNPHPSRIAYDLSAALANLNSDTGPSWILYWDLVRYGTLVNMDAPYYNLESISVSDGWLSLVQKNGLFLSYYFDPTVLTFPAAEAADPAMANDRNARVGIYSNSSRDNGVLSTQYFERINPKVEGICDYDAEIWMRLAVAGDNTVIYGEFMPSIPGCTGAINWDDNRVDNQSIGMALLAYQDQASNITSHMLMQIRASLVQLWLIDKDSLEEPVRKEIEKNANNASWWVDPKILLYSATKLRELGINDPTKAFSIVQNEVSGVITAGYTALAQLITTIDRLLILSPNELGQPNPREVSAGEVQEISTSVQSISSFRNQGPRDQVAAKKQLIYESLVCCASEHFTVPIMGKYTERTLKAAGFKVSDAVSEATQGLKDSQVIPSDTPIMGSLQSLLYDYYFDDRDGAERVVNTKGAQVIMQILQSIAQMPGVPEAMGPETLFEIVNTAIRMSGAPGNFQLKIPDGAGEGQSGQLPQTGGQPQPQGQPPDILQQIMRRLGQIEEAHAKLMGPPQNSEPPATPPSAPPSPPAYIPQSPPAGDQGNAVVLSPEPT